MFFVYIANHIRCHISNSTRRDPWIIRQISVWGVRGCTTLSYGYSSVTHASSGTANCGSRSTNCSEAHYVGRPPKSFLWGGQVISASKCDVVNQQSKGNYHHYNRGSKFCGYYVHNIQSTRKWVEGLLKYM